MKTIKRAVTESQKSFQYRIAPISTGAAIEAPEEMIESMYQSKESAQKAVNDLCADRSLDASEFIVYVTTR